MDGSLLPALVHVDDILCACVTGRGRCVQFLAALNRYVPTNDLGELRWYAGRDLRVMLPRALLPFRSSGRTDGCENSV